LRDTCRRGTGGDSGVSQLGVLLIEVGGDLAAAYIVNPVFQGKVAQWNKVRIEHGVDHSIRLAPGVVNEWLVVGRDYRGGTEDAERSGGIMSGRRDETAKAAKVDKKL
jgi:hypothetical protein